MPAVSKVTTADYLSAAKVTPTGGALATLADALAAPLLAMRMQLRYPASQRIIPLTCTSGNNPTAWVANKVYYVPYYAPGLPVTGMWVRCTTGVAGAVARLGLYAAHATTGLPDALLVDAGTVDCSGTGEKTVACSLTLPDRIVWAAAVCNANLASLNMGGTVWGFHHLQGRAAGTDWDASSYRGWRADLTYGALPASAALTNNTGSSAFIIGLIT